MTTISKRLTSITIAAVLVTSIASAKDDEVVLYDGDDAAILEGKAGAMGGFSNALAA